MKSFFNKLPLKSLIDKATQDDQTPTPGFLFNEINKQSFASVENCQIIQDLLLKRLQHSSPDVKFKTLRVIKQLVMKGHRTFRSELQRRIDDLQPCLNYRGAPDPLRGDKPFIRVREEAQEIMKLVFVEGNRPGETQENSNQMESIHSASTSAFSGRITGTGNYIPPEETSNLLESIKKSTIKLASKVRGEQTEEFDPNKHWAGDSTPMSNFGLPPSQNDYNTLNFDVGERISQPGTPGGSWNMEGNTNRHEEIIQFPKENETHDSSTLYDIQEKTPEKLMVDKTTTPGGVRSVLSKMEVGRFVREAKKHQIPLISYLLYDKLQSQHQWQCKLKALCLLEGLLSVDEFVEKPEIILPFLNSPQSTIQEKSRKILEKMNFEIPTKKEEEKETKQEILSPIFDFAAPSLQKENEVSNSTLFQGLHIADSSNDYVPPTIPSAEEENISCFDFITNEEDEFSFVEKAISVEKNSV